MTQYPHVLTKILSTPWLIVPESLQMILEIFDRKLSGDHITHAEAQQLLAISEDRQVYTDVRGVGIIPIHGPIFPKANMMTEMSGATSLENVRASLREAVADRGIDSILLDIDSPGGMSDLVMETAYEIRQAREVKPIYAVANTMAASAAYWLGSQATQMFVTPSGMVGSIGVYTVHEDLSRKEANEGRKTTLIHAGRFKVEGNPYEPLSEEGRSYIQGVVNQMYESFIEEVAEGRGTNANDVMENFGQGRLLTPDAAVEAGMVDGVATMESVATEAWGKTQSVSYTGNSANTIGASSTGDYWLLDFKLQEEYDTVEQEHSEPGSGVPPEPRKQEPKDRGGTENRDRLESPPEVLPRPVTGTEANVNEFLVTLAESIGIEVYDDMDDAQLSSLITEKFAQMNSELEPLRDAAVEADKTRSFRQQYPEEYERMVKLEERDRTHAAKQFADRYEYFTVTDESGASVKQTRGFSALVQSKIEDAHVKLSTRSMTQDDLAGLLDSIPNGIVEFGERGSARSIEDDGSISLEGKAPKFQFADKVREIMEQDELSYADAVKMAAKNHPELYKQYRESLPLRTREEA